MPPSADLPVPGHFRPRLTLQTLTRGDGLLGLRAAPGFGPRGAQLTVAQAHWTYATAGGLRWETPAPQRVLNTRPKPTELLRGAWSERVLLLRDLSAEADAQDALWASGLRPLPHQALQWRRPEAAEGHESLWSLAQEQHFGDFWAEQVPKLQALGWQVVVRPGFAHETVPVQKWRLLLQPLESEGRELAEMGARPATLKPLRAQSEASWMLSLGVELDGETLDLVPLLAELIKREPRWLDAREIAAIPDTSLVRLKAPGGRPLEARAKPLKAIVGAMVDLLTDPDRARAEGPIQLSSWEAHRLQALQEGLADTMAARAGEHGAWQLQGEAGLAALTQRLREAGSPPPVAPPAGLGLALRGYQRQGLAWLQYLREHRLAGILADDMGLGKTAQVLAHLLLERQAGRLDLPALVVLPTSLVANWQAECRRVAPALRTLTLQGTRRRALFEAIPQHDVVFTTYPLLWRDAEALSAQPWHLLILDEAQMVKNAGSRAAGALRKLRARHRLCVTGTPLENHLGELWAHFDLLMPGFLGDARSFNRQWRRPIETNGETLRAQLLSQRVRPFILRRRKEDVAPELPPRTEVIRRVQLQGAQRDLYESVRLAADEQVRRVLQRQSFAGAQIAILDALLKLRQVCCDPRLVKGKQGADTPSGRRAGPPQARPDPRGGALAVPGERGADLSAKLELLLEMLRSLVSEGRRVLVFSQFTEMLGLIGQALEAQGLAYLALTGQTPPSERGTLVQRFQSREHEPVLLLSLKAGGVGLNLTAADTVIHFDPWWNPAVERQASDRAHRIGQDRPVFIYKLVVEGSIEERMLALQERKAALAEGVIGRDGAQTEKFSQADLQGLLAPLADSDV